MNFGDDLHVRQIGNTVVLRATNGARWLGAAFGGFAVFWLIGWIKQGSGEGGPAYWFGVLLGLAFIMMGLYILLPRAITTTFDLSSRCVFYHLCFCKGLYQRRKVYAFSEVAGLGIKEYAGEGYSYMPVLVLRNGSTRWLATMTGGCLTYATVTQEACAATGLASLFAPHGSIYLKDQP